MARTPRSALGRAAYLSAVSMALVLSVGSAHAVSIPIANPGFEDISGQLVTNEFTLVTPNAWQLHDPNNIVGNPNVFVGTLQQNGVDFFNGPAPEGSRVALTFNRGSTGNLGEYGYQQTLSAVLEANTRYELSVEVGNIASGTSDSGEVFNLDEFPGYRIDLLAGVNVLVSDLNSLLIPEAEFRRAELSVTIGDIHPALGEALAIRLVNLNLIPAGFNAANSPDLEVDFDDVRLSSLAVPAPPTLALSSVLLVALVVRGKRPAR